MKNRTLPSWRFRRAGTPGFYATWARPALFATGLVTNLDARGVQQQTSAVKSTFRFRCSRRST